MLTPGKKSYVSLATEGFNIEAHGSDANSDDEESGHSVDEITPPKSRVADRQRSEQGRDLCKDNTPTVKSRLARLRSIRKALEARGKWALTEAYKQMLRVKNSCTG